MPFPSKDRAKNGVFYFFQVSLFLYIYFFLPRTKMVRVEIGVLNVRYRRLNSPSVPVPAIFLRSSLRVGWFYHMNDAAIGEKKNRQVCPHQSVAKITCDFRWRSNSLRSSYKMPRCVASLRRIASYVGWQYLIACFGVLKFPQDQKTS